MKVYIIDPENMIHDVFATKKLAEEFCDIEYPNDPFIKGKIEEFEVLESLEEK